MFGRGIKLIRSENYTYFDDGGRCVYIEERLSWRKKKITQTIYSKEDKELTKIIDGSIISVHRYDDNGNLILSCNGNIDRFFTYDNQNHLIKRVTRFIGDNHIKSCSFEDTWEYDIDGNCIYQREGGEETFRKFDHKGNKIYERRSNGFEYTQTFDEEDRIIYYRDSNGECEKFLYNEEGQLVEKFQSGTFGECLFKYKYDQYGNLCCTSNSNGFTVWDTWVRCNGNEFKCRTHADSTGLKLFYKYDEHGNMIHSVRKRYNSDDYWVYHRYDKCGHLIESVDSGGSSWKYEYNQYGDCRRIIHPNGKITIYRYCYDDLDRVILKETLVTRSKKYKY